MRFVASVNRFDQVGREMKTGFIHEKTISLKSNRKRSGTYFVKCISGGIRKVPRLLFFGAIKVSGLREIFGVT